VLCVPAGRTGGAYLAEASTVPQVVVFGSATPSSTQIACSSGRRERHHARYSLRTIHAEMWHPAAEHMSHTFRSQPG
jgi:hypothetical protein